MKLEEALRSGKRIKRRAWRVYHNSPLLSFGSDEVLAGDWEIEPDPQPPLPQKAREWEVRVTAYDQLVTPGANPMTFPIRVREILEGPDEKKASRQWSIPVHTDKDWSACWNTVPCREAHKWVSVTEEKSPGKLPDGPV